jgi:hypothetical protein
MSGAVPVGGATGVRYTRRSVDGIPIAQVTHPLFAIRRLHDSKRSATHGEWYG